jgi:hypothetical protein
MQKGPSKYEFEGPFLGSRVLASGFPAPPRCAPRFGRPLFPAGRRHFRLLDPILCVRPACTRALQVWPGRSLVFEPTRTSRCVERFVLPESSSRKHFFQEIFVNVDPLITQVSCDDFRHS